MFALLDYIKRFNDGEVWLEETRRLGKMQHWNSDVYEWPKLDWSDGASDEVNMFPYLVMENVREALTKIAAV